MSDTTTSLFGWEQPTKSKRGQPHGNPSPIGSGPAGETCRTCAHSYCRFAYWKCELTKSTNGPGSDIRLKWAACAQWRKKEEGKV